MKWLKPIHRDEKGVVLIGALIVLVFVAIAIVPALDLTASHLDQTSTEKQETFNEYAADAGFQEALFEFTTKKLFVPNSSQASLATISENSRTVNAGVLSLGSNEYKITSVATDISGDTYTVEAHVLLGLGAFDYAIATTGGNLDLAGNVVVTSSPDSNQGDIHANGDITVSNGPAVQGDATATGTITDSFGGIAGTSDNGSDTIDQPPVDPAQYLNEANAGGIHIGDYDLSVAGNYTLGPLHITGDLTIDGITIVTLTGTVYVDGAILMAGQSEIKGGEVIIAEGDIDLMGQGKLSPPDMPFVISVNGNITLGGNNWTSAILYAMNGDIVLGGESKLYGAAVGENVTADGNSGVEYCTELGGSPVVPLNGDFELLSLQHGG